MNCEKAEEIVRRAREHGWEATIDYDREVAGLHSTVMLSNLSGDPDDPDWRWGIMLRWYRTSARSWRMGVVGSHSVVGVYEGRDGVEHEFWLRSMQVLRDTIANPSALVAMFEQWTEATVRP